jgi:hypothetical protein
MLKKHPSYNKTLHLASLRAFATSKQEDKKEPNPSKDNDPTLNKSLDEMAKQAPKKLTTAELDEQLRDKMEGRSGEGGEAGVEYEDGKPVAMKRSVKNNMFRLI